jgi:hypothetical protein
MSELWWLGEPLWALLRIRLIGWTVNIQTLRQTGCKAMSLSANEKFKQETLQLVARRTIQSEGRM